MFPGQKTGKVKYVQTGEGRKPLKSKQYGINASVILDPGAGPCINNHGNYVLVSSTCSKRQDVFAWKLEKRNVFNNTNHFTDMLNVGIRVTVVKESSDPLPEIQTGDPGCSHVASTANQMLDQINVLVYHGNMEGS